MIVNPVFSKSGKGIISILKHPTEKTEQKFCKVQEHEIQISNLFQWQQKFHDKRQKARQIT